MNDSISLELLAWAVGGKLDADQAEASVLAARIREEFGMGGEDVPTEGDEVLSEEVRQVIVECGEVKERLDMLADEARKDASDERMVWQYFNLLSALAELHQALTDYFAYREADDN